MSLKFLDSGRGASIRIDRCGSRPTDDVPRTPSAKYELDRSGLVSVARVPWLRFPRGTVSALEGAARYGERVVSKFQGWNRAPEPERSGANPERDAAVMLGPREQVVWCVSNDGCCTAPRDGRYQVE